jgi:CheY-like chemotaxis protein
MEQVSKTASLPDDFVEQVKQALENLYNFPYLQRHPLAQPFVPGANHGGETAGERLRRELVSIIEALSPGADIPFRSPHARLYNLVHLHYVEGLTIREAANDLGLSNRQAYRDLKQGQISIAQMYWAKYQTALAVQAAMSQPVRSEIRQLDSVFQSVDLCMILRAAMSAVDSLAAQQATDLQTDLPDAPLLVYTDPTITRQVVTSALSHTLKQAAPGVSWLRLENDATHISIILSYQPKASTAQETEPSPVTLELIAHLGWTLDQRDTPDGWREMVITLTNDYPLVLIIDDNEALVDLLKRYLAGHPYRVISALHSAEGIRLAGEMTPDVIVLDVMMPDMDGWEVLQRLHTAPNTQNTPVIICSIFNDPELAYSLRASCVLPKPVSQNAFLEALKQVGVG